MSFYNLPGLAGSGRLFTTQDAAFLGAILGSVRDQSSGTTGSPHSRTDIERNTVVEYEITELDADGDPLDAAETLGEGADQSAARGDNLSLDELESYDGNEGVDDFNNHDDCQLPSSGCSHLVESVIRAGSECLSSLVSPASRFFAKRRPNLQEDEGQGYHELSSSYSNRANEDAFSSIPCSLPLGIPGPSEMVYEYRPENQQPSEMYSSVPTDGIGGSDDGEAERTIHSKSASSLTPDLPLCFGAVPPLNDDRGAEQSCGEMDANEGIQAGPKPGVRLYVGIYCG